jgi:quercetin dioxygenase-like cupin family protein
MRHTRWMLAGALALWLGLTTGAGAQDRGVPLLRVRPADLQFTKMYNGTSQANVVGDITQAGPYAVRTILPAGLRIKPHFHPEARIVLVMSGTLYVGFGERFDDTAMTPFPPGSVFTEPATQPHFTWAKDGDVTLHVTGVGPTGTTWIEPPRP